MHGRRSGTRGFEGRNRIHVFDDRQAARGGRRLNADGFIDELELAGKLSAEGTLELPGTGAISGLSASVKPEVSVALTLLYAHDRGRIEPEKAEAKASIEASLSSLDLGALAPLLPGAGGNLAIERLRRFATAGGEAKVAIETTIAVEDLDALYRKMEGYFANPETVSVAGTIDLVRATSRRERPARRP